MVTERERLLADAKLEFAANGGVLSLSTEMRLAELGFIVDELVDTDEFQELL